MPDESSHRLDELKLLWESDPSSKVYLQLAGAYREKGKVDEAIQVLSTSLQHRPRDPRGRILLARCHVEKSETGTAIDLLEEVLRQDAAHLEANKLLVECYLQAGDAEKAGERLGIYRLLNDRDPELDHLQYRLDSLGSAPAPDAGQPSEVEITEDSPTSALAQIPEPEAAEEVAAPDIVQPTAHADPPEFEPPAFDQPLSAAPVPVTMDPESPAVDLPDEPPVVEQAEPALPDSPIVLEPPEVPDIEPSSMQEPADSSPLDDHQAEIGVELEAIPESTLAVEGTRSDDAVETAPEEKGSEQRAHETGSEETEPEPAEAEEDGAEEDAPQDVAEEAAEGEALFDLAPETPAEPSTDDLFDLAPSAATGEEFEPDLFELWEQTEVVDLDDDEDEGEAVEQAEPSALVVAQDEPAVEIDADQEQLEEADSPRAELPKMKVPGRDSAPPVPEVAQDETGDASDESSQETATLGRLYLRQGHLDEAERIFHAVLAREPESQSARDGLAGVEEARKSAGDESVEAEVDTDPDLDAEPEAAPEILDDDEPTEPDSDGEMAAELTSSAVESFEVPAEEPAPDALVASDSDAEADAVVEPAPEVFESSPDSEPAGASVETAAESAVELEKPAHTAPAEESTTAAALDASTLLQRAALDRGIPVDENGRKIAVLQQYMNQIRTASQSNVH